MIVKLMLKIIGIVTYMVVMFGFLIPVMMSAQDDLVCSLGFILIGFSIIGLYLIGRYWIYKDLKNLIKGVVNDFKKVD